MNLESFCAINSDNVAAEVLTGHSLLQTLEPKDIRDCSIKSISTKYFFFLHPVCRYILFIFPVVKRQGTGFGLPFYIADSMLAKKRSGVGWEEIFKLSPQRCFSYERPLQSRDIWNPSLEKKQSEQTWSWKKGGKKKGGRFKSWKQRGGWWRTIFQLLFTQDGSGGKGGRKGCFAARVFILPLEGKLFMFIMGRSSLPVFMYSKVQINVFCMCVCPKWKNEEAEIALMHFSTPASSLVWVLWGSHSQN